MNMLRISRSLQSRRLAAPLVRGQLFLMSSAAAPISSTLQKTQGDQDHHQRPWLLPGAALAASAMATTAFLSHKRKTAANAEHQFLFGGDNVKNASIRTSTSTNSTSSSTDFKILTSLEAREELQKMQVARFLRDLYDLAQEQQPKPKPKNTLSTRATTKTNNKAGYFSLTEIEDLQTVTPQEAQSIIAKLHTGLKLDRRSLLRLFQAATKVFQKEPTLVDLRNRTEGVTVVGDLHGELGSLQNVLDLAGDLNGDNILVITGDYIDRGECSLEVFCTLLLLKLAHPKNVVLLRGNHEDTMVSEVYGFLEEIQKKYAKKEDHTAVWREIAKVFSALPICARTETVLMIHGGLPFPGFQLDQLAAMSSETRAKARTVVDPRNDDEQLLELVLWSDPTYQDGIHESPRGSGIEYGPNVVRVFLNEHNLKYIVRSHQPVEQGVELLDCGDERGVVTVFSAAGYLDENSLGAVLKVFPDGTVKPFQFSYQGPGLQQKEVPYEETLRPFVEERRLELSRAFEALEKKEKGTVTAEQWAVVMAEQLDLLDIPWREVQPRVAPTVDPNEDAIDWRVYLRLLDGVQAQQMFDNQEKLLSVFKFLDTNGDGVVDRQEFLEGVKILNRDHLDPDQQITNPKQLFDAIDIDRSGEIDMDEFKQALESSQVLKSVTKSLDSEQLSSLKQNREMLLTAFKFLDLDGNGSIDYQEFSTGVELLNKRLPDGQKFKDIKALFDALDVDSSGEIDLHEFNQIFQLL